MKRTKGMGGHQSASAKTSSWITPPEIIKALGPFDLDPCAATPQPWPCAKDQYTIADNGLLRPWYGRVWLNPPYGNEITAWLKKMSLHKDGISLVFARTDRRDYHEFVFPYADSMLLVRGRFTFYTPQGIEASANGGAPNLLIAYGEYNSECLASCGIEGLHVPVNRVPCIVVAFSPSWKSVVSIAISRLGYTASVDAVYKMVERIAPDKVENNKFYKEKIRQKLQEHFIRIGRGHYTTITTDL